MDYLFLDASFFRMHPGSPAEPVLAAWGISTDGKPVFIGLAPGAGESTDAWVDFLAEDPATRSNTSVCLKVVDPAVTALSDDAQADFAKKLAAILEKEGVALDIGGYRDAPAGLRIWCGATVETSDLEALTPWLDWAFASIAADLQAA